MTVRIDTLAKKLEDLEERFEVLFTTAETGAIPHFAFAVSNPPTDAELDAGIGLPADLPVGYVAFVDDTGSIRGWLVLADGTQWWHAGAAWRIAA